MSLTPSHPSGGSPVPERKPTFDTTTQPSHKHIAYNHPSTYSRQPSPTSQRTSTETDYDDKLNLIIDYYYNNLELIDDDNYHRKPYGSLRLSDVLSSGDRRTDTPSVRPGNRLGSRNSMARVELPSRRRILDRLQRYIPTRLTFTRPSFLSDWLDTRQMVDSISEHQRSSVALSRARHATLAILNTEEAPR